MIRAGSDIGGTFTDVILFEPASGAIRIAKIPSSADLGQAVLDGIAATGAEVHELGVLVHGSTIVINALIERKGAKTALITTAGFRDVYEIGRINRPDSFNVFFKKHAPLVPRSLCFEVVERCLPDRELTPLDTADVDRLIEKLIPIAPDAIAVMLLHSYANPAHELKLKHALKLAFPLAFISASSELTREYREYERTSTVAANAYVGPTVDQYLAKLDLDLAARAFAGHFYLMQSNGGLIGAREARRNCISLIESGPAGGVIGTARALQDVGLPSGVAFDMGGTTAKAGVVESGIPRIASQYFIGSYNTGLPVLTPVMDIHEVGTGGGSIASISPYGELRVGPRSAGAKPGPACYGGGGTEATVTDANVALGRLNAALPLAGSLALDAIAAENAVRLHVAAPLGVSVAQAALGIVRVANTAMAYAIAAVTIERGLNPADFALVAYGGAGPLHATQIARELAISEVLVPPNPGVFSAYGMLFAEPQAHASRTRITPLERTPLIELNEVVSELIEETMARLALAQQHPDRVELFADMRYVGQEHTVNVAVDRGMFSAGLATALKSRFDDAHLRCYSHCAVEQPAEIVTLRCVSTIEVDKPAFVPLAGGRKRAIPKFAASVWLDEDAPVEVPFYAREDFAAGTMLSGPAVVFEETASTLLLSGDHLTVHPNGHLLISIR